MCPCFFLVFLDFVRAYSQFRDGIVSAPTLTKADARSKLGIPLIGRSNDGICSNRNDHGLPFSTASIAANPPPTHLRVFPQLHKGELQIVQRCGRRAHVRRHGRPAQPHPRRPPHRARQLLQSISVRISRRGGLEVLIPLVP